MRRSLPAALLLACVSCASLSGLAGEKTDAGADDAGLDVVEASETATDAAKPDATSPDGTGGTFCTSSSAYFCADFDEGAKEKGWSEAIVTGTGALDLDSVKRRSAPQSLRASGMDSAYDAFLRRAIPASGPKARLSFAMNGLCPSASVSERVTLAKVSCLSGGVGMGSPGGLILSSDGVGDARIDTAFAGPSIQLAAFDLAISPGTWHAVVIESTFGSAGHLKVVIDSIVVLDTAAPVGCVAAVSLDAFVGIAGQVSCSANFDDVVLETAF